MIILIGAFSGALTGQSHSLRTIASGLNDRDCIRIDSGGEGIGLLKKIAKAALSVIYLLWVLLVTRIRKKSSVVYFTPSRSVLGFLREVPYYWLPRVFGTPSVAHLHGADLKIFYNRSNTILRLLLRKSYSKLYRIIVLTDGMKEQCDFLADHESKCVTIPNFVDLELFQNGSNGGHRQGRECVRILFLSNLIPDKGFIQLLRAYDILTETGVSNLELIFAGGLVENQNEHDDSLTSDFMAEVARRSSIDNVFYVGPVYGSDKINLMQSADLFVLPSFYQAEAFPLVILEACAAGCYIITTRHNYLPEVVSGINCTLVDVKDPWALAEVIKDCTSDIERIRMLGRNNAERAVHYSFDKHINRIREVLDEAMLR